MNAINKVSFYTYKFPYNSYNFQGHIYKCCCFLQMFSFIIYKKISSFSASPLPLRAAFYLSIDLSIINRKKKAPGYARCFGQSDYSIVISSYSSADIRPSTSEASAGSTTIIHACSYGDSFTYSGLSSSSSFTSSTLPLIGAYNSETVLTDSTLPNGSPAVMSSPSSGSSTNTISPSSDCAKCVIPIR